MLGAVGFVLLMACVNVANLLLARGANRQKETAIKVALGAGRARIIRHLLIESLLLALSGGALGLLITFWGVSVLRRLAPDHLSLAKYAAVDGTVLVFALAASLATSVAFGLIPAIAASKVNLTESLNESGRSATLGRHRLLRNALVISQVAAAIVLLTGSGLLIRSFLKLQRINPGFDPNNLLIAQTTLPGSRYKDKDRAAGFFQQSLEKLRALPGVKSASLSYPVPMTGGAGWVRSITVEGERSTGDDSSWNANCYLAGPDYFSTLGIPLLRGRTFTESDMDPSRRVTIINETLAHRYFGQQDPIGKQLKTGGRGAEPLEIVGIVGDVKQASLTEEPKAEFYVPFSPGAASTGYLAIRSESPGLTLAPAVRRAIASVDKDQPIYNVRTMDQILSRSLSEQRFITVLLSAFAGQGLVLSAIGIYGVVSYFVNQRTREIGVRIALGAEAADVLALVVKRSALQVAAGLALGVGASLLLGRLLQGLLYDIGRTDPYTYAGVALLLATTALAATYLPARRATKIDPMIALRTE